MELKLIIAFWALLIVAPVVVFMALLAMWHWSLWP